MTKFTFLVGSARANGNAEQLAHHASQSLNGSAEQLWLNLNELPLPPFQDVRHLEGGNYLPPTGNAKTLFDATVDCDHLVFVSPVYWYSLPTSLKHYLDYWSEWMRVEGLDFKQRMKGKTLWAISSSAGSEAEAEPMLQSLRLSANYMQMNWGGHVLGTGDAPGEVLQDTAAMEAARHLFENVL